MTGYPGPTFPSKSKKYTGPYCPALFEQLRTDINARLAAATDPFIIERLTVALAEHDESERAMRDGD